jgi:hypothetical protein
MPRPEPERRTNGPPGSDRLLAGLDATTNPRDRPAAYRRTGGTIPPIGRRLANR